MTAPVLPDAATDPARYVLAVADLREKRTDAVMEPPQWRSNRPYVGPWRTEPSASTSGWTVWSGSTDSFEDISVARQLREADAVHIVAEANPVHVLAEVALWRFVAKYPHEDRCEYALSDDFPGICDCCRGHFLAQAVTACQAYMDGAT